MIMITTRKTILVLGLCFSLFYNCSNDNSFIEEIEGAKNTETTGLSKTNSQEIYNDVNSNTSSEVAGKTLDGFNGGDDNPIEEEEKEDNTIQTIKYVVTYNFGTTEAQKATTRENWADCVGLIGYRTLSERHELWTLDSAIYYSTTATCPALPEGGPITGTKDVAINADPDINTVEICNSNWGCN